MFATNGLVADICNSFILDNSIFLLFNSTANGGAAIGGNLYTIHLKLSIFLLDVLSLMYLH